MKLILRTYLYARALSDAVQEDAHINTLINKQHHFVVIAPRRAGMRLLRLAALRLLASASVVC